MMLTLFHLIEGNRKSETNFISHDWFIKVVGHKWVGFANQWVCYPCYIVYWRPANISIGHFVDQPLKCNRKSGPVNSV